MPKRKRSYNKKRSFKRRKFAPKRRRGRSNYIPRGLRAVSKVLKMRFCQQITLDPGAAGTLATRAFRANGIYDPDHLSGNKQPMFYDQAAQFYNHYVVLGAKCTAKVMSGQESSAMPCIVGLFLSDDVSVSTLDINSLTEQNRSTWRLIPHTYTHKPSTLKRKFSAKKFFNIKDVKDNLLRVGASFGADPTEQAHFVFYCGAIDNSTDGGLFNIYVMIDYIVLLSEPKEMPMSA